MEFKEPDHKNISGLNETYSFSKICIDVGNSVGNKNIGKEKRVDIVLQPIETTDGGPNGIRTRVTDVRGRCPRPLDDGTMFLIQFQMSNAKFQINSAASRRGRIIPRPKTKPFFISCSS